MQINEFYIGQRLFSTNNPEIVYKVARIKYNTVIIQTNSAFSREPIEYVVTPESFGVFVPYSVIEQFADYKQRGTYSLTAQLNKMIKVVKHERK